MVKIKSDRSDIIERAKADVAARKNYKKLVKPYLKTGFKFVSAGKRWG